MLRTWFGGPSSAKGLPPEWREFSSWPEEVAAHIDPWPRWPRDQVADRRHDLGRSIVVITHRSFREWGELLPNAARGAPLAAKLVQEADVFKAAAGDARDLVFCGDE